ncbi:MAG: protoheme IX farnesyltransferase [Alphaproteobacteria bacterium]|nr:protoheme IX farnesyltransferase [Alphaproteobacteria bacterium]
MADTVILNEDGEIALRGAQSSQVRDYFRLLKPRVMTLVVFSGATALMIAPGDIHPLIAIVAIFCIAIGSGAAGAINMWYERDIDAIMTRTANRPLPMGRIAPSDALGFAVVLSLLSVALMGLATNWVAAGILAVAILFYVFVYTVWLKRRTPQNIVIGGAAGAFPPMIGWAAVTGDVSLVSLSLFAIIFLWTPPHFWALALYRSGDYERAGVPMLPVVAGHAATRRQILYYTVAMLPVSLLPSLLGATGLTYAIGTALLGLAFVYYAWQTYREADGGDDRHARALFKYSICYLFLVFALLPVDLLVQRMV